MNLEPSNLGRKGRGGGGVTHIHDRLRGAKTFNKFFGFEISDWRLFWVEIFWPTFLREEILAGTFSGFYVKKNFLGGSYILVGWTTLNSESHLYLSVTKVI